MGFRAYALLALLFSVVIFAVQNYEVIEVEFLIWSFRTSRAILIFSVLVIGIIIGWLTASKDKIKKTIKDKTASLD